MITTWKEIIDSDIEELELIGYGSLMNTKTHFEETRPTKTVKVNGFKRIYNVAYPSHKYEETTKKVKNGLTELEISKIKEQECKDGNNGALNCKCTGDKEDKVNGLLLKIKRKSFDQYKDREDQYELHLVNYIIICPETGKKTFTDKKAYILVSKVQKEENITPYALYHELCLRGAYKLGTFFGKMYERTTYSGNGKTLIKDMY